MARSLTDVQIKGFIAARRRGEGSGRLAAGNGLRLVVATADGAPLWQYRYRLAGKERIASLGKYPTVTLSAARAAREEIKRAVSEGRDPSAEKRQAKAAARFYADSTFGAVAAAWLKRQTPDWSAVHAKTSTRAIERDVLPTLGAVAIDSISSPMVADVIDRIVQRGAKETASRVLEHMASIFDYGKAIGLVSGDNPAGPVREILPRRDAQKHHPALHDLDAIRGLVRKLDLAPLTPAVRMAHKLVAFTAQRLGNVLGARWGQFNLDAEVPTWSIPRADMKVKSREHDHVVVLGPTIAGALREWKRVTAPTSDDALLFASPVVTLEVPKAVTLEAMSKSMKTTLGMRGTHRVHGWRASFSTAAYESGLFSSDAIELALDHVTKSAVAAAYDRGQRFEERRRLAEWWDAVLTGRDVETSSVPTDGRHLKLA